MSTLVVETKICAKCKLELPYTDFNKSSKNRDKLQYYCRNCSHEGYRKWRLVHFDQRAKDFKTWIAAHQNYMKEWKLQDRYGLSLAEWVALYEKQNGKCALCHISFGLAALRPVVDHNHLTKQVRGLIHQCCNLWLAAFENVNLPLPEIERNYLSHDHSI